MNLHSIYFLCSFSVLDIMDIVKPTYQFFSTALLLTLCTRPSARGKHLAMPPEEGLMVTPKVLLLWGSLDSSIVSAVLSSSTKETASAWSSSLSRSGWDRPLRQPVSWFWIHLSFFEPIPGSTHYLQHSQVLPFPSAVSTKSGHHPGECKFQILHWPIDVDTESEKQN